MKMMHEIHTALAMGVPNFCCSVELMYPENGFLPHRGSQIFFLQVISLILMPLLYVLNF